MRNIGCRFLVSVCLLLFIYACSDRDDELGSSIPEDSVDAYSAEVVTEWYDLIKTLTTETPGYTPPVAARAFGYTSVALYEALVPGMPNKVSLSGKLTDLNLAGPVQEVKAYHWPTVANTVLADMTGYFYNNTSQDRLTAIAELRERFASRFTSELDADVYEASSHQGERVAKAIIAWSESDGGKNAQSRNFPDDYAPPEGEQFWIPTAPDFQPALQPYWGGNRPFLAANVAENIMPAVPPEFSSEESSVCYQRALEVYETVNTLTTEQLVIAEYWSDDPITTATPPGHSISILNQLIKENDTSLDVAAEVFAKLGIGISDAFISCWKVKYDIAYIRPITFINRYIDADWRPVLNTPPFPEYTSGHSVQSGAMAAILTEYFGENYRFTDRTHENRSDIDGTPRVYDSFRAMAEEAAISRLYGGIHFTEAIDLGLKQGYDIGNNVVALKLGS